jgi:hypothetical protein
MNVNAILACLSITLFVSSVVVFYLKNFFICIACGSLSVFASAVLSVRMRRRAAVESLVTDSSAIENEPQTIHHI